MTTLQDILCILYGVIILIAPIIASLALIAFFWGLAMFLFKFDGKEEEQKKGRAVMVYGVVVIFVMVSIFGIVNLLQRGFGTPSGNITPPSLNYGVPGKPPVFRGCSSGGGLFHSNTSGTGNSFFNSGGINPNSNLNPNTPMNLQPGDLFPAPPTMAP